MSEESNKACGEKAWKRRKILSLPSGERGVLKVFEGGIRKI